MADNWRDGLNTEVTYKRKFAFVPTQLSDGDKVWFKPYYRKFVTYYTSYGATTHKIDEEYAHTDVVEDISEETYVVRKLSENL